MIVYVCAHAEIVQMLAAAAQWIYYTKEMSDAVLFFDEFRGCLSHV